MNIRILVSSGFKRPQRVLLLRVHERLKIRIFSHSFISCARALNHLTFDGLGFVLIWLRARNKVNIQIINI